MVPNMLLNPVVQANKYKTNLCRHFSQMGTCSMGVRCHFAHGQDELRKPNDPLDVNKIQQNGQTQGLPNINNVGVNPLGVGASNFKTIKCRYFELGICKYSEGCHFSHGENDTNMLPLGAGMDSSSLSQMMIAQQYQELLKQQQALQGQVDTYTTQYIESQQPQQSNVAEQQPQQVQYSVQNDPQIQKEVTKELLQNLIDCIQSVQLTPSQIYKLSIAKELLSVDNLSGCSLILDDLLYKEEDSQKEEIKKQFDKFVSDTSELSINLMAEQHVKYKKQQEDAMKEVEKFQQQQQQQMQANQQQQQAYQQQQPQGIIPPQPTQNQQQYPFTF